MTYSPSLALKFRYCVVASETPGWFILCDRETMRPIFARHTEEDCWEDARISDKIYKSLIGYANQEKIPVPKLSDLRLPKGEESTP